MIVSPIKAVAFDAFGTLVEIQRKKRPYAQIAKLATQTPALHPMQSILSLSDYAHSCGVDWQDVWAEELEEELDSVQAYPEARSVLLGVHQLGLKTAVASNLALPYAKPLFNQLGDLIDVSCLSFEMGVVKPDPAFYQRLCNELECQPYEVLMVGDTWRCDYQGATEAGLLALHLDRHAKPEDLQQAIAISTLNGVITRLMQTEAVEQ